MTFTDKLNAVMLKKQNDVRLRIKGRETFLKRIFGLFEFLYDRITSCEEQAPEDDWEILRVEMDCFTHLLNREWKEAETCKLRKMELDNEQMDMMLFEGNGDDDQAVEFGKNMKQFVKNYNIIKMGVEKHMM